MARSEADIQRRRSKILPLLGKADHQHMSYKALAEKLGVSLPTIRKDIEALEKEKAPIKQTRGGVTRTPHAAKTEFDKRLGEQQEEKEEIARVAVAVTLGGRAIQKRLTGLVGLKEGWNDIPLKHLLSAFLRKSDRSFYSDAGTTTRQIFRKLAATKLPEECSHLKAVTNSPGIAEETYETAIGTVLIGGELRRERHSVVGILAEKSLDALDIVADLSFIGATGVDMDRGFTSDDVMEARMKARMLELARIRCAVIDHTKITLPGGTFAVFTPFSPKRLDFVISDDGVLGRGKTLRDFREMLKDNGICLLTPKLLQLEAPRRKSRRGRKRAE